MTSQIFMDHELIILQSQVAHHFGNELPNTDVKRVTASLWLFSETTAAICFHYNRKNSEYIILDPCFSS